MKVEGNRTIYMLMTESEEQAGVSDIGSSSRYAELPLWEGKFDHDEPLHDINHTFDQSRYSIFQCKSML